jgi:hypothetical protein
MLLDKCFKRNKVLLNNKVPKSTYFFKFLYLFKKNNFQLSILWETSAFSYFIYCVKTKKVYVL